MASRTLTLALAADIDNLKKGLSDAEKSVKNSQQTISDFGKKAALAFAAAGAAAGAFAISAVKAAAEDEKSRKALEQTIRANTRATDEQIKSIDTFISRQAIATATTDDVLRPALSRLVRSTQDVTRAQELLTLAQEISVATGKPLESVTNALGKAYDGSNTALGKLGLGIDAATLKSKSFDEITKELKGTYNGFIANEATNAEFKFRQLTIALDESREKIGEALLPIFVKFADYLLKTVVPNVQAFVAALTGDNSITSGITKATEGAFKFGEQVRSTLKFVVSIKDELIALGTVLAGVFVVNRIAAFVGAIGTLITAMKTLRTAAAGAGVATAFATGGASVGTAAAALAAVAVTYGLSKFAKGGDENTPDSESSFTYGSGNPLFGLGGSTGGTGGGGFGGGSFGGGTGGGTSGTGGTSGGKTGAGGSTFDQLLNQLKQNTSAAKNLINEQMQRQAQIDFQNRLLFNNALANLDDPAILRANRLAELTFQAQLQDDPEREKAIAERARLQSTTNIYVSGAVDPEGTARAVANALNSQAARSVTALRDR